MLAHAHRALELRISVVGSVGSKGDSFDNALAETVNGLYKAELINRQGPWRNVEQVELETAAWVHWLWTFALFPGPEFTECPGGLRG